MTETPQRPASDTKITQVSYGMTVNVGNYQNVKFELTAAVALDEDWRDVLASLKRKTAKLKAAIQQEHGCA